MEQITKWIIGGTLFLSLIPGCAINKRNAGTDNKTTEQVASFSRVEIKPSRVELAKSGSLNLVVYIRSESGDELRADLEKDSLYWVSDNPEIAEVD